MGSFGVRIGCAEPVGAQEGPKLGLGGSLQGVPRAEIIPDPLGSAGTGLFASTVMGKLPAERLFNTERNNLISNYWCRTLGSLCTRRGRAVALELLVSFVI